MSTRHGKDPNRVQVFRGCGMYVAEPYGDGALIHYCDRPKWHKGACSTLAMRRAARQEADR